MTNEEKRKEIGTIFLVTLTRIGMDRPVNFKEIVQFIYEDVCEVADSENWGDGDVVIGFRRWIESKQGENNE